MAKIYSIIILIFVFSLLPSVAQAGTISLKPATGSFETGERVAVKVIATSTNVPFNAVSGSVAFPTDIFSVESISKNSSALNFWVSEPSISNGIVKFEGIALGGFSGSTGTIITVNLRAIKAGSGQATFKSGQILANDGEGTDITGNLVGASYSVIQAILKPPAPKSEPTKNTEPAIDSEPEIKQPTPSLAAPEIVLGEKYGSKSILGTSQYAKTQVLMTFIAEDGVKIFILGMSDAEGEFNLVVPNSLRRGSYTVSAVMIKEDKTNSQTSNVIVIDVGNAFSDIGKEVYFILFLLVLAVIYLLIRVTHHFKRGKYDTKEIKQEVVKAENVAHKSFDILREDIAEYDSEKISDIEHRHLSTMKKDINEAEKIISKQIKDIDL